MPAKLILPVATVMLVLAGCAQEIVLPTRKCPAKNSVDEALAALESQSRNAVPLKASGTGRVRFYAEDSDKPKKESLDVKLRANPPAEIYLQGDKPLLSKAIALGSNDQDFWLAIRPKEISWYVQGKWAEQKSAGTMLIDPRTILDALGIGQIDTEQDWSLSNEGAYDILTRRNQGVTAKKIHIWCCDYRTRKIELFNSDGLPIVTALLDKYVEVSEGFHVPTLVEVTTLGRDEPEKPFTITINLTSIQPSKKWPGQLFVPLSRTGGFKNRYQMINGKLFELPE